MSACSCGQIEIPLGMSMCNDPRPGKHVTHGVTACVGAGTDWERRAEAAEAAIQRVRDWLDSEGFPVDTESPYGQGYHHAMNDARRALGGDA